MKKIFILIITLLIIVCSTGCMTVRYNFAYEYEDLRDNLVRAELIYIDGALIVFAGHGLYRVDEFDHTVVAVFSEDDFDDLIESIVDLPFRYSVWYFIASQQDIYYIYGYVIALYYENDARILIGETAEHRKNTTRWLSQNRTGRYLRDGVWNGYINNVLSSYFDPN